MHHITDDYTRLEGVDEETWIDVIRKMDEVYSDLLQHQVALEEQNAVLEETQQFINSIMSSMSDVLIVCDQYGAVIEVNHALAALMGRTPESFYGESLSSLFADEASRQKFQQHVVQGPRDPVQDCEIHLAGGQGSEVPVAFNCSPRYDQQGRQVGLVLVGRPVGELRRAYETLQRTIEELRRTQQQLIQSEKMASLGRLVAGVAHELNNPISFVLGNIHALRRYAGRLDQYLDLIHARAGSDTEIDAQRRALRIDRILEDLPSLIEGTVEGAERSRDIVDGLKRFSAIDREGEGEVDLAEVTRRAVHWVSKASARAGIEVEMDLPDPLLVHAAAGHMQQVITNLVQNAEDAASEGEGRLRIRGRVVEGEVRLDFHDSGPGIAPEHIDRVFEPFFTTKPVGKGTGLGLSISYGLVERAGGRMEAANHPDGGAVFTLWLPFAGQA